MPTLIEFTLRCWFLHLGIRDLDLGGLSVGRIEAQACRGATIESTLRLKLNIIGPDRATESQCGCSRLGDSRIGDLENIRVEMSWAEVTHVPARARSSRAVTARPGRTK